MNIQPVYDSLPFSWEKKSLETVQNDCQWLESIIRNAAPFSDGWVKARIVQLAYPVPPNVVPTPELRRTYQGLTSEAAIAQTILSLCENLDEYPYLAKTVNEEYVIDTLNHWKNKKFTQASARNFEVYASRQFKNVFLVTSTAPTSLHINRKLPPSASFRPLFNINELAEIMRARSCARLTLRTHGYASPFQIFYKFFIAEANALNNYTPETKNSQRESLSEHHFYIGYHWPSEQPIFSPGLWVDFRYNWEVILKFLFLIFGFASIFGIFLYLFLKLFIPLMAIFAFLPGLAILNQWRNFSSQVSITWYWLVPVVFVLWLLLMQILRIVVYQRDRYRSLHYGAPDLAEFFWRLDKALNKLNKQENEHITEQLKPNSKFISVNLIGHSMGCLLLVNTLRILSDRFGKDDETDLNSNEGYEKIGDWLILDKLILAAPDIPLEFLREGRNNYVRSAMRRCREIYLLSSDRDLVLRYLSTLGNWFSEPSIEMSGYRLGNVYLQPTSPSDDVPYRPFVRNMFRSQPAVKPTSACDLFELFNYIDCSEMEGLNSVKLPLNETNSIVIDTVNFISSIFKKLDTHGGYFFTDTPVFTILKLLILEKLQTPDEIAQLIAGSTLRFLPSYLNFNRPQKTPNP